MDTVRKRHLSSFQIIIFGFAGTILIGALLLMLPISSAANNFTNFLDALFTATSAVCVTGLVVYDTATHWSYFGQFIIITLIQIGGLGVVTIASAIVMILGRKIGLMQRSTMQTAISASKIGGIVRLTGFILKATFIIELTGALIMAPVYCRDFGILKGIWVSVFHSISAFCNAGFDLMGTKGEFSSLTTYVAQPVINIVIMLLIIIGGIGFLTWDDIRKNKFRFRRYTLQSKMAIITTIILILVPAIYFYLHQFQDSPMGERILSSFFQSVTPRTAGFNTVDLTKLNDISQTITTVLMLIGGSPGSTAGGMKTTTIAVMIFTCISIFRQKDNVECLGRRIPDGAVKSAATILMMYITLFLIGGLIISGIENIPIENCLFETASAIGTVGLSLGLTPTLGSISKIILILLMYFGRVGGLTLIFAAIASKGQISKFPQEKVTIG